MREDVDAVILMLETNHRTAENWNKNYEVIKRKPRRHRSVNMFSEILI